MIYNPYPQVDLPFGKDNLYFKILFDAIYKVDESFVNYTINVQGDTKMKSDDLQEHVERVFAYELYRQWANLLEENGIRNLVLNGEISKGIIDDQNRLNPNEKECGTRSIFPDLVLHASQENDNNQLMVCEIKREKDFDDKDFLHDLYKLYKYINKEDKGFVWAKPFIYGIFILVGSSVSLENLTKLQHDSHTNFLDDNKTWDDFQTHHADCSSHIVCITYNGTVLEYNTLDNMYPELKQNKNESNIDNINYNSQCPRGERPRTKREEL